MKQNVLSHPSAGNSQPIQKLFSDKEDWSPVSSDWRRHDSQISAEQKRGVPCWSASDELGSQSFRRRTRDIRTYHPYSFSKTLIYNNTSWLYNDLREQWKHEWECQFVKFSQTFRCFIQDCITDFKTMFLILNLKCRYLCHHSEINYCLSFDLQEFRAVAMNWVRKKSTESVFRTWNVRCLYVKLYYFCYGIFLWIYIDVFILITCIVIFFISFVNTICDEIKKNER